MQAPGAALPELDALGAHEEAAPMRRARDLGAGEALLGGRVRRARARRGAAMTSLCGDAHALRRAARGRAAK